MRVLVCGGRDFGDRALLEATLDKVHAKYGHELVIIEGTAKGADLMAECWAKGNEVPYIGVPAKWKSFGKAAGMERNKRMRDQFAPTACIAFKGGVGTLGMVRLMREIGVDPWLVGWDE